MSASARDQFIGSGVPAIPKILVKFLRDDSCGRLLRLLTGKMHVPAAEGLSRSPLTQDLRMSHLLKYFHRDERGATATEYALLIVFVALAIAVGANVLGGGISNLFGAIGNNISSITPTLPTAP
jgi:pilus assembly protein Flp/PilA